MEKEFVIECQFVAAVFRRRLCSSEWELAAKCEHGLDAVRFAFSSSFVCDDDFYVVERQSLPILVAGGMPYISCWINLNVIWK